MTKAELKARIEFENTITSESKLPWSEASRIAALLMRHGRTYARIQEAICNGVEWTQWDTNESFSHRQANHEKWTEKRDAQLEKRIKTLVLQLGDGFGVVLGGDPRGTTVKLTLPSGRTNDFAREGYCVPGA